MGNPQFRYLTVENVEIILGGGGVVYRGKISIIQNHPLPRIISVLRNEQFTITQISNSRA